MDIITNAVGFTVQLQGLLDKYAHVTARMDCDHAQAREILDLMGDLCVRASLLHEKDEIIARDANECASPKVKQLISLANEGYETRKPDGK